LYVLFIERFIEISAVHFFVRFLAARAFFALGPGGRDSGRLRPGVFSFVALFFILTGFLADLAGQNNGVSRKRDFLSKKRKVRTR